MLSFSLTLTAQEAFRRFAECLKLMMLNLAFLKQVRLSRMRGIQGDSALRSI